MRDPSRNPVSENEALTTNRAAAHTPQVGTLALLVAGSMTGLLLVAAGAKSLRPAGWTELARLIAGDTTRGRVLLVAVPLVETCVAIVLVVRPRVGLVASALLLAGLAAGVQLLRPRLEGVRCSCFGALAPGALDADLVRRNAVLALAASAAAWFAPAFGQRPGPLLAGVFLAALLLAVLRGREAVRRWPLAIGSRVRFGGPPSGRPLVVVAVSAGCAACDRLVPALRDIAASHPEVDLVVAVAPSPGAAALRASLGPLADERMWQLLSRHRRVPGTPYAISLDASRRVLAASGVDEPRLRATLADLGNGATATALSRGQLLRVVAATGLGVLIGVLPSTPAVARMRRRADDWTFQDDDRNDIHGSCERYKGAFHRGVYDQDGKRLEETAGYTYAEGFEIGDGCSPPPRSQRLPTQARVNLKRVTYEWRGHCPCPQNMTSYTDPTLCAVECPKGLACFGYQCVTDFEQYCVEVMYSLRATKKPEIIITALQWYPPDNSSPRCKVYAKSFREHVRGHEEQHAKDVLTVIDQWEMRHDNQYLKACAPTREAAEAAVKDAMAKALDSAYPELVKMDCELNSAFHSQKRGQGAMPRCEMCEP